MKIEGMEYPFQSILIYGMGMMGASLAHALRPAGFSGKIGGVVRTEKSAIFLKEMSVADTVYLASDQIPYSQYDVIVIGLPVRSAARLLKNFPECQSIITDMSSTRGEVAEAAESRPDLLFVGSHPMCGSEDTGPTAAKPDLFYKKLCILTEPSANIPSGAEKSRAFDTVRKLWENLGMKTYVMDPADHDRVLAYLSHGPHIISTVMARWASSADLVCNETEAAPDPLSGGGLRDMLRIAGSNPEMWLDIVESNSDNIKAALVDFRNQLDGLISSYEQTDWMKYFAEARKARNFLCRYPEEDL